LGSSNKEEFPMLKIIKIVLHIVLFLLELIES